MAVLNDVDATVIFQVWHVNGDELSLIPVTKQRKLYSGDCYIVQYTYPENGRDENLFYSWFGRGSAMVSMVQKQMAIFIFLYPENFVGHELLAQWSYFLISFSVCHL